MINANIIALIFHLHTVPDTLQSVNSNEIITQIVQLNTDEKYDEALSLLHLVNPVDSNYLKVRTAMIEVYANQGQIDKATALGSSLMEQRTDLSSNFYVTLGNGLLNNGYIDEGITIYKEGAKRYPYYHVIKYNLGYATYKKGDYTGAVKYFQEVLKLSPYYSSAHQMMGNIMAKTNQRTKAILSYLAYLAINPDENWALVKINNLVSDAFREEDAIEVDFDNQYFEYYDNLLKSRAALSDGYQTDVDFEAPVVQQCELLMSKLKYVKGTDDFWMNFYVPFLADISSEGLSTPFLYFMLTSANNDDITNWLEKHTKEKDLWIDLATTSLSAQKKINVRTIGGVTGNYTHWYYDNNRLQAIGAKDGDKTVGPFEYYYANGRLQANGVYDANGNKEGYWQYYHDNGQLKSRESHNEEGNVIGEIISYRSDGMMSAKGIYKNDDFEGIRETYFANNNIEEQYPYIGGVGNGQGKVYFETGEVRIAYQVKDDEIDGDYVEYFKTGDVRKKYTYNNGDIQGEYNSFHSNGQLFEHGQYEEGDLVGTWVMYHDNGNVKHKGNFKADERIGEWNYYFFNGIISYTEQYNEESELHGLTTLYDEDGTMYAKRTFDKGILVSSSYYDKSGAVLTQEEDPAGNLKFIQYFPTGQLRAEGMLVAGDITGPYSVYFRNGNIHKEGTMIKDEWDGEYKEYDESGALIQHCTFDNGVIIGYYRTFHVSGNVKEEGWIANDNIQQQWNEYYFDGTLESETFYSDGELDGTRKEYGPKGYLTTEEDYRKGTRVAIRQYDSLGIMYNEVLLPNGSGEIVKKSPSGQLQKTKTVKYGHDIGNVLYYNHVGKLDSKYNMEGSVLKNYESYYLDGVMEVKGAYLGGEPTNDWIGYFESGVMRSETNYNQGKREGESKRYYEDGKIRFVSNYYQGKRNGPTTYHDRTGKVQMIKYYKKDFGPYAYQYYLTNGTLSDTVFLTIDKNEEVLRSYFDNGKPAVIQHFVKGYFHGDIFYYDANGQVYAQDTFKDGLNHGKYKVYYPDGQLQLEVDFQYDVKHGTETKYHENGQVKSTTEWLFDKQNGWYKTYDKQGKLLTKTYYWNDFQY